MNVQEWLKTKHGPLPGWAYVGIGAVGLYAFWRLRSRAAGATGTTGSSSNPLSYTPADFGTGGGGVGGGLSGGGTDTWGAQNNSLLTQLLAAVTGITGGTTNVYETSPQPATAPTTPSTYSAPAVSTPVTIPSVSTITNPIVNSLPISTPNSAYSSWYNQNIAIGNTAGALFGALPSVQAPYFNPTPIGYSQGSNTPVYQPYPQYTVPNPISSQSSYTTSGPVPSSTFGSGASAFQVAGHYVTYPNGQSIWVAG